MDCSRMGCIGWGEWMPQLIVPLVGYAYSDPLTFNVTLRICDVCKPHVTTKELIQKLGGWETIQNEAQKRGKLRLRLISVTAGRFGQCVR